MKWFILILFIFLMGILILYWTGKGYLLRGIKVIYLKGHSGAYIDDWPQFENAIIAADPDKAKQQQWELAATYNQVRPTRRLSKINETMGTVAFLILQKNRIWYEHYAEGYGPASKTNSYSMAKSITVSLLGKAIEEGFIKGLHQRVSDFFPEFRTELTVGDLASMASGMRWNEDYDNPFSSVAQLYLEKDLRKWMRKQKLVEEPGKRFDYNSGNTQLLGMILEQATGQSVSQYLSEKFWKPMGMQEDAYWEYDSVQTKMEKTYCCIAGNARDFARFGRLFTQNGNWNGEPLLSSHFVTKCLSPRFPESPQYGYGFWLSHYKSKSIFAMRGILGQYVISIPEDDLLIVRLGKKRGMFKENRPFTEDFYAYIDETYAMLKK